MTKDKAYKTEDGKVLYDNAPTVVVGLIPTKWGLIVIDRADGSGWALPGGFQMKGETWQEALSREIEEELGITLDPVWWSLHHHRHCPSVATDEFGHNVLFASYNMIDEVLTPNPKEVKHIAHVGSEVQHWRLDWAFDLHKFHALSWLYNPLNKGRTFG